MRALRRVLPIVVAVLTVVSPAAAGRAVAEVAKRAEPRPTATPERRPKEGGDEGSIGRVFKSIGKSREHGEAGDRDRGGEGGSNGGGARDKDDPARPREQPKSGDEGGSARKHED